LPIAHGEGAYFAEGETLDRLEQQGQIVARYCTDDGVVSEDANPNGSARSIAAVANPDGNVVGLMPHPERAADPLIGGTDGLALLRSVLEFVGAPV
jgi:phosphoribosylformylglycinamidine synthase